MKNEKQQVGISGRTYLIVEFIVLFVLFAFGLFRFAPSGNAITGLVKFLTGGFIIGLANRSTVMLSYIVIQSVVIFWQVLDTPLFSLAGNNRATLRQQLEAVRNNSHAIIFVGIILSGLALATIVTASTPDLYMFGILSRGVIGEMLGTLATMAISISFGIRSMDEFRDWINQKDNDSHAILVATIKVSALVLCLVIG